MKRVLAAAIILLLASYTVAPNEDAAPTDSQVSQSDELPSKAYWTMLHMVDETQGWAIRDGGIYRTSDGGKTWTNMSPPGLQIEGAHDPSDTPVYFHSAERAWVALSQNRQLAVYRTVDGGQTWHVSQLDTEGRAQFHFVDDQYGWMLLHQGVAMGSEQVEVYRTADGGETWTKVAHARPDSDSEQAGALPFGGIKKGVGFTDANMGWITAEDRGPGGARLYKTTDGGASWHKQVLPVPEGYESHSLTIYPPRFFSPVAGLLPATFVPGYETVFYYTNDGGETWAPTSPVRASITSTSIIYSFVDARNGWTTDGDTVYATQDGGLHWTAYPAPGSFKDVKQLQFLTAESGWAVTDDSLWITNDGGRTWRPASGQSSTSASPGAVGEADPSYRDWAPPTEGSVVPWRSLPAEVRQMFEQHGERSPDGDWIAARVYPWGELPQLWLADATHTTGRFIQAPFGTYAPGLWSPHGTYLYWRSEDDSWQEVYPATGERKPFLPGVLTGKMAGSIAFSPSGQRLLYTTGLCYCNRAPQGPLTTFVVNLDGTGNEEVGVNVDARWEGERVRVGDILRAVSATAPLRTPGPIGLEPFTAAVVREAQAASDRPDYQLDITLTNAWQVTADLQLAAGHFENGAGLLIRLDAGGRAELVGIGTHGAPGPASIEGVDGDLVLVAQGTGHVTYNYKTGEVIREQRRSR